ncbi:hypothetical protein [Nostoc sp.]|uniref:hypothetical protein n=1 Tax=Nostoc sp. TaxID=1180 RepID=UPI002FF9F016
MSNDKRLRILIDHLFHFRWLRFQTALVGTNQRSLFPHPPIPVAISRPKYFTGAIGEGII